MAQVYSQNAVGYINITIKPGFNLVGNQLIQAAGPNNTSIGTLLPAPPQLTTFYGFTPGSGFSSTTYDTDLGGWDPSPDGNPALTLPYGGGGFIFNPSSAFTLTLVGDVGQGSLANPVPSGFSIRSSKVPQAGAISAVLGFPPSQLDVVNQFANPGGYSQYTFDNDLGGWDPSEPVLAVGEAIFIASPSGHPWTRVFSVN